MSNYQINVLKTFFDFYVITALDVFCGESTLNYANKGRRISETCARVVDEFYQMVLKALQYSVLREFRHLNNGEGVSKGDKGRFPVKLKKLSRAVNILFKANNYEYFGESHKNQLKFLQQSFRVPIKWSFEEIANSFEDSSWDSQYGGKRWAKATKMLLVLPQNQNEKILWIDRVLDLYHNNGHLLNKSMVSILSCHRTTGKIPRKKRSALNYRKHAKTLSDLAQYSSIKVRNLLIANKARLPKQII